MFPIFGLNCLSESKVLPIFGTLHGNPPVVPLLGLVLNFGHGCYFGGGGLRVCRVGDRLLLSDPEGGEGGLWGPGQPRPTRPPTSEKFSSWEK